MSLCGAIISLDPDPDHRIARAGIETSSPGVLSAALSPYHCVTSLTGAELSSWNIIQFGFTAHGWVNPWVNQFWIIFWPSWVGGFLLISCLKP
ncbi:hypothetical protein PoB_001364400 [Plakobranchus ocellatus]|uniref:Uncharacterized protein n=1 Tax=Plakobranchus ocellatus TaxID=259542 RepID=A0AAV3YYE6_9GAST|nr:hypothetical protein PoB_001364400 [Plakobranchus ocellatus]